MIGDIGNMKYIKYVIVTLSIIGGILLFKLTYKSVNLNSRIDYKVIVNGVEQTSFPSKGAYIVETVCINNDSSWDYDNWKLVIKGTSSQSTDSCYVSFTSTTYTPLNTYIISLLDSNSQVTSNDGILKHETFIADGVTTDTGYRYEGPNPNNYVLFNNELWRIIGVFDTYTSVSDWNNKTNAVKRVKLIRDESIGSFAFDRTTSRSTTTNGNAWSYGGRLSNIAQILNGPYLNHRNGTNEQDARSSSNYMCAFYRAGVMTACDFTKGGIQDGYDDMIESVVWHLRGYGSTFATYTQSMYNYERTGTVNSSADTEWVGKVGLMYPSDYGYSALVNNCSRTGVELVDYGRKCGGTSWILKYGYELTICPNLLVADRVWALDSEGDVSFIQGFYGYTVRPSIYLTSNTYHISGEGSKSNPYVIIGA